ncbi:hypothetical protein PG996_004699 [Apiospora saccharicola]|uniref:Uncharacterized protein n=1 Tax=Apiospora saccharicola TaxID=335842 RepID=A0ABR1W8M2_9PEZI
MLVWAGPTECLAEMDRREVVNGLLRLVIDVTDTCQDVIVDVREEAVASLVDRSGVSQHRKLALKIVDMTDCMGWNLVNSEKVEFRDGAFLLRVPVVPLLLDDSLVILALVLDGVARTTRHLVHVDSGECDGWLCFGE